MAALQPTLAPTFDPANSPTYDMSTYTCRWNNCSASFVTFGEIIVPPPFLRPRRIATNTRSGASSFLSHWPALPTVQMRMVRRVRW